MHSSHSSFGSLTCRAATGIFLLLTAFGVTLSAADGDAGAVSSATVAKSFAAHADYRWYDHSDQPDFGTVYGGVSCLF